MSPESDGKHEQIRLDVDGAAPQMTASGAIESGFGRRLQWIASLRPAGPDTWEGPIWFKDGAGELLPQSTVRITATKAVVPNQRRLTAVFYGGGPPPRERVYPSSPVAGIDADGFRTGHIAG